MTNLVFITGEIGINHNGDLSIAKQLIDVAKKAGCDAVKFQKRTIEKVYSEEILDSPRESIWGTTTREQKLGLEFEKNEYLEQCINLRYWDDKAKDPEKKCPSFSYYRSLINSLVKS